MKNNPNEFDLETQRLLDKVCEGVEVEVAEDNSSLEEYETDDGYGSWEDEAWHDAQEYPEW